MRIAYITPYQGPTLGQRRPITLNRSLAGSSKMEVVAKLLKSKGHEVEIFSQGEVVERAFKFYPGFKEPKLFDPQIPVEYSSVLPVRFINGIWQGIKLRSLFLNQHRMAPFDCVIIYNMKVPQLMCHEYALQKLKLPVILEYEDDIFLNIDGKPCTDLPLGHVERSIRALAAVSGGMACSPYLLDQISKEKPRLLLRGVVGDAVVRAGGKPDSQKKNWVLFSGTHFWSKGIAPLIRAWPQVQLPGWELHITGDGEETPKLKSLAAGNPAIHFHGVVSSAELAEMMSVSKICANPHELSLKPGNVFAFKIVEYLASGAHVISTPMGSLEKEIEAGITYMPDNQPETIARTLQEVVAKDLWRRTAREAVLGIYGPQVLGAALDRLVRDSCARSTAKN